MQVASLDWLPSQTSPISFHHLNLCYTRHLFKCSSFPQFVPLAQKPFCDTAAISEKFQVTGEESSGALAWELFSKINHYCSRIQWAITDDQTAARLQSCHQHRCAQNPREAESIICTCMEFSKSGLWHLFRPLLVETLKVPALPGECLLWVSPEVLAG